MRYTSYSIFVTIPQVRVNFTVRSSHSGVPSVVLTHTHGRQQLPRAQIVHHDGIHHNR